MAQTPAHAPTTDARRVSIISSGMDIELEDSAFGESLEQEQSYNPFQGIDGLEGCSLTGLGSALSRQKTLVVHSSQKLVLWRQLRGGSRMETIHTDIVERLYSGHLDTKPFLDPEPPVEVQVSLKQSHACGVFRRQQRDMDPTGSCSVNKI